MQPSAQVYGRALTAGSQWLRQYRHTRVPRALQTALACRDIAAEKLAIWRADLKLIQSAMQAERVARFELSLDKILREIQRDESMLRETGLAPSEVMTPWPSDLAEDEPNYALEARPGCTAARPAGGVIILINVRGSKVIRRAPVSRCGLPDRERSVRLLRCRSCEPAAAL